MSSNGGWIGVDLDGTLALYDGWKGADQIGPPVPLMLQRVIEWLAMGHEVRIVTARVCRAQTAEDREAAGRAIEAWCQQHLGRVLKITAEKDFGMVTLYDDRAVTVEQNTGILLGLPRS